MAEHCSRNPIYPRNNTDGSNFCPEQKDEEMRKVREFGHKVATLWILLLAIIVLCAGCATSDGQKPQGQERLSPPAVTGPPAPAEPTTPKTVEEKYYIHTIKWSGETISIIAGWYTGDIQNWRTLAEANPEIDPNKVSIGMRLRIPERIMTTKAPMTKEHVDSFYAKGKRRGGSIPVARPKKEEEEPTLFGPK